MNDLSSAMGAAASGMQAQATRLRHVSENIANSDTPGYRRKLIGFEQLANSGRVETSPVRLDQTPLPQIYDPGNALSDETGYYLGSNVDMIIEIADAREAQRSYDANLRLFDQARQMTQSLFDILRR